MYPQLDVYYENGNKFYKTIRYFDDSKQIKEIEYFKNDNLHNEQGPASILYYPNGEKHIEYYYCEGKYHRKNGPAIISYFKNGSIRKYYYYYNNERHHDNIPAIIEYYITLIKLF